MFGSVLLREKHDNNYYSTTTITIIDVSLYNEQENHKRNEPLKNNHNWKKGHSVIQTFPQSFVKRNYKRDANEFKRHEIWSDKTQGKINFKTYNAATTVLDKPEMNQEKFYVLQIFKANSFIYWTNIYWSFIMCFPNHPNQNHCVTKHWMLYIS